MVPGMTRSALLLATALLAVPATAEAAKVKVGSGIVSVGDAGVAGIKLTNPNRSAAKGKLTLKASGRSIGSKGFSLRARRSANVKVPLSAAALSKLAGSGQLQATAVASAKGKGTSRKGLLLRYGGAPGSGGGGQNGPGGSTPGGNQPNPGLAAPWQEGRWKGTWATNSADLSFNVVGNRLFSGPYDDFYIDATCQNVDPEYTGPDQVYTDAIAIEPVEASIAGNGDFSGAGTYQPSPTRSYPWTLTGRLSGGSATGTFAVNYTDGWGNPCSGSQNFTASWFGDYTF